MVYSVVFSTERLHGCWYIILFGILLTLFIIGLMFAHNAEIHIRPDSTIKLYSILSTSVLVDVPFKTAIANNWSYLLPRAVFFDKRHRDKYKNTFVVLAHLIKTGFKPEMVIACKVNDYIVETLEIKSLKINKWLHQTHPQYTHDDVLIFCYDMPTFSKLNDSLIATASVVYINPKNRSELIAIASEHPPFVPKERDSHSTVMACTTVFDTPPHFGAWIRYQKTLGVDMVHINAQESFLNSSSFTDPFFLESLRNGYIQLTVWKEHLSPGASFYHSQALYYQSCLYRYLGVHEYCVCADTEDFLTIVNEKDLDIHTLIKKIFRPRASKPVGSSALQWIRYFEPIEGFNPPEDTIADGNLTRYLNTSNYEGSGGLTKSIYKLPAMIELAVHESAEFLPQTEFLFIKPPQNLAYMAHIKKDAI